ncbi:MAG: CsgG/HfaB family protein [Caulobacteraceae bacterium]
MKRRLPQILTATVLSLSLGACNYVPPTAPVTTLPIYQQKTTSEKMLSELPAPDHPIPVAVYGFADQTGQFKLTTTGQNLSRAVSQGGGSMLIRSLEAAGQRKWFTVIEREQLRDLLNERQIIREMRSQYLGEKGVNPQALPALLFAGVILEGGIISYDTNTLTGGLGATLLGIGGTAKYTQDTVTVYLRAVSVKTGEVLATVTTSKTVTAYALDGNVFKYIASDKLLETEDGYTTNEPEQIVLQQAIDKAVYGLVMEGVDLKLWNFSDSKVGWPYLWRYQQERDGALTPSQVIAADKLEQRAKTSDQAKPASEALAPSAKQMAQARALVNGEAAANRILEGDPILAAQRP